MHLAMLGVPTHIFHASFAGPAFAGPWWDVLRWPGLPLAAMFTGVAAALVTAATIGLTAGRLWERRRGREQSPTPAPTPAPTPGAELIAGREVERLRAAMSSIANGVVV